MPAFKQTPASLRYLKARLTILKRPTVWATASGLILSVFLVGEYLANPQQYTGSNDPGTASHPPNQNPLGNLPTQNTAASNSELFETLSDVSTVPLQTRSSPQSSQSDSPKSPLFQEFLLARPSTAASKDKPGRSQSPLFSTPYSAESWRDRSPDQLPSVYSPGSATGLAIPLSNGVAISSSASSTNSSTAINPLQSALERYSSTEEQSQLSSVRPLAQSSAARSTEDSELPELSETEGSTGQNFPGQPDSSPQRLPSPQFSPQISPSPGTTGYTLPLTLQTPTPSVRPSSFNINLQPIPGQITPQINPAAPGQFYDEGQPSHSTGQPNYPKVQPSSAPSSLVPAPFSVPRAAPGRSIGGGQINTFSNP